MSFDRSLKHACVLQYGTKYLADFLLQNFRHIFRVQFQMICFDLLCPLCVRGSFRICTQISAQNQCLSYRCQLILEPGRQHSQAHDLNETDIFLLDMVLLSMGMEHTQRTVLCSDIIPQH